MLVKQFSKTIPIVKIEEGADGLAVVYGLATSEAVDSDNERCIYEWTKPEYQKWSESAIKSSTSAGQGISAGNIRVMHTAEVGGKVAAITFDDARKQVWIKTIAKDAEISRQLREGYYLSYSQGGRYTKRVGDRATCGHDIPGNGNWCTSCEKEIPVVDYGAEITEVSYVDRGANPEANYSYVKTDGSIEIRKFKQPGSVTAPDAPSTAPTVAQVSKKKTKRVAGEDLPASAFAFVGDSEDTSTWKLPIHFSAEEKSARHTRNALARFSQTQGIPESEKSAVLARIKAAAHRYGIDVEEESKAFFADLHKAVVAKAKGRVPLSKGLYEVGRFAELLQGLAFIWESSIWEADYEEDDSKVPGMLQGRIEGLAECLVAMCEEEARELTAAHKAELAAAVEKTSAVAKTSTAALSAASGEIRKGAIMNEETLKALFKGGKEGMHKLAGHFKKMAEDANAAGQIHESIAADNKAMAEAHDTAADLHAEARKSTETGSIAETSAEFHKKGAEHHKKMAEHHAELAEKCMKMHKAHMAACKTCKAMGDGMEDDEAGKAARVDLAKADEGDAPAVPGAIDVADIVQKAVAAANAANAATVAALQKSISDLNEKVEKKTDPVNPSRLRIVPPPGTQQQGDEKVSIEVLAGAVGI